MGRLIVLRVGALVGVCVFSMAVTISLLHILHPFSLNQVPIVPPANKKSDYVEKSSTNYLFPRRLAIAKLSIEAPINAAGLNPDNSMYISEDGLV